jgi:hypothetical protein
MNDPILDPMRRTLNRNLLAYACARAITCPACGEVLDQSRAVLVTGPHGAWIGCTRCWAKGPFCWESSGWSVLDGRLLFATPRRVRSRRGRTGAVPVSGSLPRCRDGLSESLPDAHGPAPKSSIDGPFPAGTRHALDMNRHN